MRDDKAMRSSEGETPSDDASFGAETGESDEIVTGHVKWFDPTKGYGFIVSAEHDRDILLHVNVLRNFGQNSIADQSAVSIRLTRTFRGLQASEVISVTAPLAGDEAMSPLPFDSDLEGGDLEPARVKWFDRAKGFGFANVFGRGDDVFIHVEVLRRSSLTDLEPGEAIAVRVAEGDRGCLATQVAMWEAALD